ncbi:aminopeptidase P family protein [Corynebacterium sp. 153RC1]|uniref:aminopeptidase P family protein n=1 Tax=unclassified Corynebacterium TaxID=2624378 RepID=UPI00211C3538|nr:MULTISPECIES: aminopeptidase P family protein [unclassified Corynebacterium]MCQ9351467.1 aminopeptidase P family protein [Corynebacterium sp. 209RC1]MCQ9354596.1 aminopeptidase P family protein [Corynebacterium sp. 1222RC1]MCQ9357347.1 aminopeptidase P family protein [Corynebacterium sp. 122RC1]MCQ9357994.1 aminopeptidase P family protein [Corynebacterium sp. 142RC1]MCQ9360402.1 aminopeptidase P family protein [Corynebacterium sp. 153RC1]
MALSDTRFSNRRRALAAKLASQRVDTMLVTHLIHVRYLSGFSGSNGAVLVNKDLSAKISTDGRYFTQIAEEVPDIEMVEGRNPGVSLLKQVEGPRRVGFEADFVSVSALEQLKEAAGEEITLVPISGVIEEIRLTKDPLELERLGLVADLANSSLAELIAEGGLRAGISEKQVAADLEYRMRMKGAERPSFDTIVASGPNSAKPHHGASDRIIEHGDLVTIDFGAHDRGFNSDTTRTFVIGEASDFAKEIYQVVLEAQLKGVEAAVPGAALADVDKACRDVITAAGYGEYFVHSTGHGVGLDLHEAPYAATTGTGVLAPGMTLTIEPGIYVPGKGGVRIEDTLVITEGVPKNLTRGLPKELQVL